jgi:hypothetical protein
MSNLGQSGYLQAAWVFHYPNYTIGLVLYMPQSAQNKVHWED